MFLSLFGSERLKQNLLTYVSTDSKIYLVSASRGMKPERSISTKCDFFKTSNKIPILWIHYCFPAKFKQLNILTFTLKSEHIVSLSFGFFLHDGTTEVAFYTKRLLHLKACCILSIFLENKV